MSLKFLFRRSHGPLRGTYLGITCRPFAFQRAKTATRTAYRAVGFAKAGVRSWEKRTPDDIQERLVLRNSKAGGRTLRCCTRQGLKRQPYDPIGVKGIVGILVLPTRSPFGDGTPRRLLLRVSLAKPTSAPLQF
jgi:hypothetical protein